MLEGLVEAVKLPWLCVVFTERGPRVREDVCTISYLLVNCVEFGSDFIDNFIFALTLFLGSAYLCSLKDGWSMIEGRQMKEGDELVCFSPRRREVP